MCKCKGREVMPKNLIRRIKMKEEKKSTLNEAADAIVNEVTNDKPELSKRGKIALLAVMLARPQGATLNEMAEAVGWKVNSVRGAISTISSKTIGAYVMSEKKDGDRRYHLISLDPNPPENKENALN